MKHSLIFIALLFFYLSSSAQIIYEAGYFIDNNGQRIDCLIKNIEWKNNPVDFAYKLSENTEVKTGTLTTVKEFGVGELIKYRRFTVDIDRSSDVNKKLSPNRQAEFNEETLFLKILVEGKADLYHYEDGSLNRFFYQVDGSPIAQLVYKRYYISASQAGVNNRFRQQLSIDLKCSNSMRVSNLGYNKIHLVKFFIKYNECQKANFTTNYLFKKKGTFHLGIKPGYTIHSLSVEGPFPSPRDFELSGEPGFRVGVSAEFTLPFNKNKWAVLIEPNFQQFSTKKNIEKNTFADVVTIENQVIEIPVGIRHYFFFGDNSKVFLNIFGNIDFPISTIIDYEQSLTFPNETFLTYLSSGAGYTFKSKYSIEARYSLNKNLLNDYLGWGGQFNGLSFILGYQIF